MAISKMRGIDREEQSCKSLNRWFGTGVNEVFSILAACHIYVNIQNMKGFVFILAKTTSILTNK
jgi:hypothetical protein